MASVNRAGGSSYTSSLYNSANIISGLASGMDTEGMIESLVQSYQTKLQNLSNKSTKIGWKQDAYRSIINKMTAFSNKYTSYTSSTNLMSSSFFNNAIKVKATGGKNAEFVTASGRTDSDVRLNSVSQLASAARYVTTSNLAGKGDDFSIEASDAVDLKGDVTLSTFSGTLSLTYGGKDVSISFNEATDLVQTTDDSPNKAVALAEMINKKLADQKITLSNGETVSAAECISVKVTTNPNGAGTISFEDKRNAGNSVYISSASDSIKSTFGLGELKDPKENQVDSFTIFGSTNLTKTMSTAEYLSGKSMNISLDGSSKSIKLPEIIKKDDGTFKIKTGTDESGKDIEVDFNAKNYTDTLNASLKKAFGGKVSVENLAADDAKPDSMELQLKFNAPKNSNLVINSDGGEKLGIGTVATNYLNTSKTLGDLLPDREWETMKDKDGNTVNKPEDFFLNGVKIGSYTKDTRLSDIMSDINANSEAGVKVSYSKTAREFVFTSKETGSQAEINIDGGLAEEIFGSTKLPEKSQVSFGEAYGLPVDGKVTFSFEGEGFELSTHVNRDDSMEDVAASLNATIKNHGLTASYNKYSGQLEVTDKNGKKVDMKMTAEWFGQESELEFNTKYKPDADYTPGQDAKFSITINGTTMDMTRSTNDVDIDGMTINFKKEFEDDGVGVSFERSTDSDKIVDAVRSMVDDYNEMMAEIRTQYATLPAQSSGGSFKSYEPLTDEERASMSESAIKAYEDKAKQGLLFGDRNLSNLYERMRDVFNVGGEDGAMLTKMGISVGFDSTTGATTLTLNENKLREALDNDPDAVADLFTKSKDSGAATDGLMQGMKTQLDRYAGLTGATKGILVQQAGTPLNSLSLMNNEWQKQIDSISNEMERWQDKLESQVDRYTSMFSKLEVLINQMNSQSSTLAGLMGGG